MSSVNVIKEYIYKERIIEGFVFCFLLAVALELSGIYLLMLLAGAVAGIFIKKGWLSFLLGFGAVALAWGIYFIVYSLTGPLTALLDLIGSILGFSGGIMIAIALIIGGLLGGVGALIGAFTTQLIIGDRYIKK